MRRFCVWIYIFANGVLFVIIKKIRWHHWHRHSLLPSGTCQTSLYKSALHISSMAANLSPLQSVTTTFKERSILYTGCTSAQQWHLLLNFALHPTSSTNQFRLLFLSPRVSPSTTEVAPSSETRSLSTSSPIWLFTFLPHVKIWHFLWTFAWNSLLYCCLHLWHFSIDWPIATGYYRNSL